MTLGGGRDRLSSSLKTLQSLWESTEPNWRDAMKVKFVEEILTPLEENTAAAMQAIDRMEVVLNQMRLECEGNRFDIFGG
jgi:hypothetical protein